MKTFRRILVATDFGEAARVACEEAARLAELFEGRVDLVHVQPFRGPAEDDSVEAARTAVEAVRDALVARGTSVGELVVARGSAAEAILHSAENLGSSLIVIAVGDRARLERATGATAETVARFARVPVWVARHESSLARVLCAVDRSDASREALRVARVITARSGAELRVVHVIGGHESGPAHRPSPQDAQTLAELGRYLELGPDLDLTAAHGRPSHTLAELARKERIDLMVLGRGGLGGLRHVFMGGTAERLLRRAPCSLLLTSPASSR